MGIKQDRDLADQLCEIDHGLTEWEVDFVEGIARQVHNEKRALTPKQIEIALKLHDKHLSDD